MKAVRSRSALLIGIFFLCVSLPTLLLGQAQQGTVSTTGGTGAAGSTFNIPVTLNLNSGVLIDTLSFGVQVLPNGGAPALTGTLACPAGSFPTGAATGLLCFTPAAGVPAPQFVDNGFSANTISVSWSSGIAFIAGTTNLGTIAMPIPAVAVGAQTYSLNVSGASATFGAPPNAVNVVLAPGAGSLLTVSGGGGTQPTVTINQAAGQADPTSPWPINFTAVFSEAVTGFNFAGIEISGTATGPRTVEVSGSGTTYNVAVHAIDGSGTVWASVLAGAATGTTSGLANVASTSSDNQVTFNFVPPPAPVITSFTPTSGPIGTLVTITGTNLSAPSAVTFNGVPATNFQVVPNPAVSTELITNGGFETGDFTGWTKTDQAGGVGTTFIGTGNSTPLSGHPSAGPHGGTKYAVTDTTTSPGSPGSGTHVLIQPFTVPPNALVVGLSFSLFANDYDGGPIVNPAGLNYTALPNQHVRVDLLSSTATPFDTGTGVLRTFYIGVDPHTNPNPFRNYRFNITDLARDGGTFQIRFAEVDNQFFLNMGVDDVSVLYQPQAQTTMTLHALVPVGATTGPISVTTPGGTGTSATNFTVTGAAAAPTVTINQAPGQTDPTGTQPINFRVVFSEAVTSFTPAGVSISGTAPGTKTVTVIGTGGTYDVAVGGITGPGTVIAAINANAATGTNSGLGNLASTSTDNSVTFNASTPQGTVSTTGGSGFAGTTFNIPVTLNLNAGVSIDSFSFGVQILNNAAAPAVSGNIACPAGSYPTGTATGPLCFTPGAGIPAPQFADNSALPNQISISWLSGLSLTAGTTSIGTIAMPIPAAAVPGQTYTLTVSAASASFGGSTNVVLAPGPNSTLTVATPVNQAPAITSANSTTFTVGVAGTFTVTATGSPAPTLSETGALPSGVTFTAATGVLSGTPAAGTAGSYPISFTATNGVTPNATQNFTLTVNQAPAITSANSTTFTVGVAGAFTVTATGSPAPTLSETGALPSGVTFTAATGVLSGTPAAGTAGNYSITFTASNGVTPNATQNFTLTVVNSQVPDLTVTKTHTGSFAQGQTGATYTITVTNSGGAATSGTVTMTDTLPTGLTATAIAGNGWTCPTGTLTSPVSCTRNDALAANTSYPALTLTVTVAGNAATPLTNTASVSGGGETNTANDTASDATTITSPAQGTLTAGSVSANPGGIANIPVSLSLNSGVTIDTLQFGVSITPNSGAAGLTVNPTFTAAAGIFGGAAPQTTSGPGAVSGQMAISVGWTSAATTMNGTGAAVTLGTIAVTIPGSAAAGQSYTIQVTGATAANSVTFTSVVLALGPNGTLNVVSCSYMVGDVVPVPTDWNGGTRTFNCGEFGNSSLDSLDLIVALRAETNFPGWTVPRGSDMFDTLDAFPSDTATVLGGNGTLDSLDLIIMLRRETNFPGFTSRPTRPAGSGQRFCTVALPCPKPSLGKLSAPSDAEAASSDGAGADPVFNAGPEAAGALELGLPEASGNVLRVPLYLNVRQDLSLAGLTIGIGSAGPTSARLRFSRGDALAPTLLDTALPGMFGAAWLQSFQAVAGQRLLLGYLEWDAAEGPDPGLLQIYKADAVGVDGLPVKLESPGLVKGQAQ